MDESMKLRSQCDGCNLQFPNSTPDERGSSGMYSGRLRHRHMSNTSSNNSREGTPLRQLHHHHHHHHHNLEPHKHHSHSSTASTTSNTSSTGDLQPRVIIENGISTRITEVTEERSFSTTKMSSRLESGREITRARRSASLSAIGSRATNRTRDFHLLSSSSRSSATADWSLNSASFLPNQQLSSLNESESLMTESSGSRGDNLLLSSREYGLDEEGSESEFDGAAFATPTAARSTTKATSVEFGESWKEQLFYMVYVPMFYVYKFSCYMMLLDVWILSTVGPHVKRFIDKHLKKFGIFMTLISLVCLSSLFSSGEFNSLAEKSSSLISLPSYDDFSRLFVWRNQRQQREQQTTSQLDEETLMILIQKQIKVEVEERFSKIEIQLASSKETKEVKADENEVQLAGKLALIQSKLDAAEKGLQEAFARMKESMKTTQEVPVPVAVNLSEHRVWLREWLSEQLIEGLSAEETEQLTISLAQQLRKWFTAREDYTKLVSDMLVLKMAFERVSEKSGEVMKKSSYEEEALLLLVRRELALYDADKLGLADYALESTGGSVINTRCTETYTKHSSQLFLLGIPLWHVTATPRQVIQSGRQPGECWPFVGSEGFLVIQLSRRIRPTAFSLDHIPKSISPTGNIDSAPKDFSVLGLESEMDTGVLLGKYQYDQEGSPLQTFPVQMENAGDFQLIELRIHSNHGNPELTCLYRFRVHGVPLG